MLTLTGICDNIRAARRTLSQIQQQAKQTPTIYLPTHDPESEQRLKKRITFSPSG